MTLETLAETLSFEDIEDARKMVAGGNVSNPRVAEIERRLTPEEKRAVVKLLTGNTPTTSCTTAFDCPLDTSKNMCVGGACVECGVDSDCYHGNDTDWECLLDVCEPGCFPSDATIELASGARVTIDSLKLGDAIVATDASGAKFIDTVSFNSYAAPHRVGESFVVLTTSEGGELHLTQDHHLPVGDACCSQLARGGDVKVGDTVWFLEGASATAHRVAAVDKRTADGLHSPVLVNGGFPVVNGLVTAFDDLAGIAAAAKWLPTLQKACVATGTCAAADKMIRFFDPQPTADDSIFLATAP